MLCRNTNELKKELSKVKELMKTKRNIQFFLYTRDYAIIEIFNKEWEDINLRSYLFDNIRIPYIKFVETIETCSFIEKDTIQNKPDKEIKTIFNKPNLFRRKKNENIYKTSNKKLNISNNISRAIAITGHRGSGITSTVANLASEAVTRGMKVVIIDLDINMRSINLYFNDFLEAADKYVEIHSSLVRCLAKPETFDINACHIKDKLWVIGLPYDFEDIQLLDNFFDAKRINALILLLKRQFNLVVLDMPIEIIPRVSEILINIDTIGLCFNNNYYSIITDCW